MGFSYTGIGIRAHASHGYLSLWQYMYLHDSRCNPHTMMSSFPNLVPVWLSIWCPTGGSSTPVTTKIQWDQLLSNVLNHILGEFCGICLIRWCIFYIYIYSISVQYLVVFLAIFVSNFLSWYVSSMAQTKARCPIKPSPNKKQRT